jgi:hypothetical protein
VSTHNAAGAAMHNTPAPTISTPIWPRSRARRATLPREHGQREAEPQDECVAGDDETERTDEGLRP